MSGYGGDPRGLSAWSVKPAGQPIGRGLTNTPLEDLHDLLAATATPTSVPGLVLHGSNPPDTDMAALGFSPVKIGPYPSNLSPQEPAPSAPGFVLHGSNPPDTDMEALGFPPFEISFAPDSSNLNRQEPVRSTWERIPLGPDLELHVQRPATRAGNRALERILASAKAILKEEGLL